MLLARLTKVLIYSTRCTEQLATLFSVRAHPTLSHLIGFFHLPTTIIVHIYIYFFMYLLKVKKSMNKMYDSKVVARGEVAHCSCCVKHRGKQFSHLYLSLSEGIGLSI